MNKDNKVLTEEEINNRSKEIQKNLVEVINVIQDKTKELKVSSKESAFFAFELAQILLSGFYGAVTIETARRYNMFLSNTVLKYTGQVIKDDKVVLEEIKKRCELVKTEEFHNLAKKADYSEYIKVHGYYADIEIIKALNNEAKALEGKRGKCIGMFSMLPDTKEIVFDMISGIAILEVDGKIWVDTELEFKEII